MKNKFLFSLTVLLASVTSFGQVTTKVQTDSLKVYQTGGPAELILENSTKGITNGFLKNSGNGRTKFAYAIDSVWTTPGYINFRRGSTTLPFAIRDGVDSVHVSNDTLYEYKNGIAVFKGLIAGDVGAGKLNTTDTTSMLSHYLRKNDTTNKWISRVNASITGALSVTTPVNPPNGSLNFSWTGTSSDFVKGNGTLGNFTSQVHSLGDVRYSFLGHTHLAAEIPDLTPVVRNMFSGDSNINVNTTTGAITFTGLTGGGSPDGNNYDNSLGFSNNTISIGRVGLTPLNASWDSTKYHSMQFYDGRYQPAGSYQSPLSGIGIVRASGSSLSYSALGGNDLDNVFSSNGFLKRTGANTYAIDNTSYQASLVSGTNLKTINGNSLLGSGDLTISGGGTATVKAFTTVNALKTSTFHTTSGDLKADILDGGRSFKWNGESTASDDGGVTTIVPTTGVGAWERIFRGVVRADEVGIKNDGTDQTSALNSLLALSTVKEVLIDNGDVSITGTVNFQSKRVSFRNNARIIGSGTIQNILIDADYHTQVLSSSLVTAGALLNREISVLWFGATHDLLADLSNIGSATDNLNAFNKAIHAGKNIISSSDLNYKRKVVIPGDANYYYLSGQLVIDTRITIEGDGSGITTLHFPSALGVPAVKLPYTLSGSAYGFNIQIKHLTIDGGASSRYATGLDATSKGIEINTPFCQFEDVEVFGFRYAGWYFEGCAGSTPYKIADYCTLINCKGNYNGVGLMFENCDAQVCNVIGGQFSYNASINVWSKNTLGNNFYGVGNESSAFQNPNQKSMVTYAGDWWRALHDNINSTPGGGNPDWENAGVGGGVTPFIFAWNSGTNYVTGNIGYFVDGASDKSTFIGCYAEGDQRKLLNNGQAVGMGGHLAGNGEDPGMIGMLQGALTGTNFQAKDATASIGSILYGSPYYTIGWKDDNVSKILGWKYIPSDKAFAISENNTLGNFGIYSSSSVLAGRSVIPNGGIAATNDALTFYNGVDAFNIVGVAKSAPTTGQHYVGDIYHNVNPATINSTRAWLCTTAGNPGTFTAIAAGGGGGSLTQYQVGVGDASNLLSGSSNFTFNGSSLKVASSGSSVNMNLANSTDANAFLDYSGVDLNIYTQNSIDAVINSLGLSLQSGRSLGVGTGANSTYPLDVLKSSGSSLARFQNGSGTLILGIDGSGPYFQPLAGGTYIYSPSGTKILTVDNNGTAVTGDLKISASGYLNYGATFGSAGYGFRDNAGTMEVKNIGGSWTAIGSGGGAGTLQTVTDNGANYTTNDIGQKNTTAATSGVQQSSPSIIQSGNYWNTTSSASDSVRMRSILIPQSGTGANSEWRIQGAIGAAGWTDRFIIPASNGTITAKSAFTADGYGTFNNSTIRFGDVTYLNGWIGGTNTNNTIMKNNSSPSGGTITAGNNWANFYWYGANITEAASGVHHVLANHMFARNTLNNGTATTDYGATIYVQGSMEGQAPTSGNYAMWIDSGTTRLDGAINLDGSEGTSGQVLTSAGPGAVPTWTTVSGGSGVTSVSGTSGKITSTGGTTPVINIGSDVVDKTATNTYTAGMKQVFQGDATNAAIKLVGTTSDPSGHVDGDIWHHATTHDIKYDQNGTIRIVANLDAAQTFTNKTIDLSSNTLTSTSAQLATALSDETGSGKVVFGTSPVINSPTIGTSGTAGSSHITTVGSVPTVSQTGAGTGGSVGVALETGSTDQAGTITITTGNASVGSTGTVTLTFNSAYTGNNPVILLTLVKGATDWGALATARITTQSLSAPIITWNNSATGAALALTANTTYKISYQVIGK